MIHYEKEQKLEKPMFLLTSSTTSCWNIRGGQKILLQIIGLKLNMNKFKFETDKRNLTVNVSTVSVTYIKKRKYGLV